MRPGYTDWDVATRLHLPFPHLRISVQQRTAAKTCTLPIASHSRMEHIPKCTEHGVRSTMGRGRGKLARRPGFRGRLVVSRGCRALWSTTRGAVCWRGRGRRAARWPCVLLEYFPPFPASCDGIPGPASGEGTAIFRARLVGGLATVNGWPADSDSISHRQVRSTAARSGCGDRTLLA